VCLDWLIGILNCVVDWVIGIRLCNDDCFEKWYVLVDWVQGVILCQKGGKGQGALTPLFCRG
jgi:hypothetical protein